MCTSNHRQIVFVLIAATSASQTEIVPDATLSDDGETLFLKFMYGNRSCQYTLRAASTFAIDASIVVYSESGTGQHARPEVSTFTTREPGNWATAILKKSSNESNMQVSGLFWCEHVLIDIPGRDVASGFVRQLDALNVVGIVEYRRMPSGRHLRGTVSTTVPTGGYRIANETDGLNHRFSDEKDGFELRPSTYTNMLASVQWNGDKWFPGCYTGDNQLHVFKVGIIVDAAASRKHGSSLNRLVQSVVARASFIYESQLNIKIEIGDLKIFTSDSGAPSYATGSCVIPEQLNRLTNAALGGQLPFNGVRHLFTGCGDGSKGTTVGLAYEDSMCDVGHNTGVIQLINEKAWQIFAHELGHNFGGRHTFEEGRGYTGGIMDYGDGKFNGEYQFNTQYRKAHMCSVMNSVVNNCQGKFIGPGGSSGNGDGSKSNEIVLIGLGAQNVLSIWWMLPLLINAILLFN